jgi:hypothetical protein
MMNDRSASVEKPALRRIIRGFMKMFDLEAEIHTRRVCSDLTENHAKSVME